ncbi:MAG TPA: valine--tRNA ligase [Candidatus Nanoarchaeia archaeon]|nr:valine--tRNA ligase [Candidatus Nanoarchaeia archaeon]
MELPKNYDPKEAEPRWQKYWEKEKLFEFHPHPKKETYSIDTPPPTVSGKMHLGHAFSYSQQDMVARFQRMRGKNVFFPFGTDDNGLPTEKLIEKSRNLLSKNMDRKDFIKICEEVIKEEKPKFIQSWKDIGMSADFQHSYSTINQHCQITSQASFIELYQQGRIYQQESPGTFCVSCQTAIAQAEFKSIDLKSSFNDIIFKCGGKDLIISTTRPELIPACVALFHHPQDSRYAKLKSKFAQVPLYNYEVPILADESVDQEKGSGLMMVCTFGDKEDADKWFRYNLPLRVVLEKNGRLNELAGDLKGLKILEARKKILEQLKDKNLLLRQQEITHAVNVHERCKTEIEFLKTKQWYIKVLDRKEELLEAAKEIIWYPEHMKVRYDHWVQNLNWDWCISRQRHFGIPIPIWTCKTCQQIILPELKDLPVDPQLHSPKKACSCGSKEFIGEMDVLDTWATSSLTPDIAGNWKDQGEYDYKYADQPFSLRPQAHDIIRTWLFYTLVKSWYHHRRIPWKSVMISGHALDTQGRKMSKSLGNIIEPQLMIQKYSADALRFWAAGSKLGEDLPFMEKDLLTGQKCINKLWNASKFNLLHLDDYNPYEKIKNIEVFDRWLLSKLQKLIKGSTDSFESYEYSRTKSEVEQFFWHTFCDQYLEIVKDRLYNPAQRGAEARKSAQQGLYWGLLNILKLIAPIMPHISEEIYQLYFAQKEEEKSIHTSSWPEFRKELIDEEAELTGDLGIDIIDLVRKFKSEQKMSLKDEIRELILVSTEDHFQESICNILGDLKAVLRVKEINFQGKTTLETERFKVKVGIVK